MASPRRPNIVFFVLAGIAVLAAVALLLTAGDDDGSTSTTEPVAEAAPTRSGETLDGDAITIGDGPAVVLFLAHWCPHCQREVPFIVDWLEANGEPEGVTLQAVTTSIDPARDNYPPDEWLARERWPIPTMVDDDNSVAAAYGVTSFPYFVAIDGDGQIVARTSGELDQAALEAIIDHARG